MQRYIEQDGSFVINAEQDVAHHWHVGQRKKWRRVLEAKRLRVSPSLINREARPEIDETLHEAYSVRQESERAKERGGGDNFVLLRVRSGDRRYDRKNTNAMLETKNLTEYRCAIHSPEEMSLQ